MGQLSGGERGRLHLAKTLLEGGTVLLLDEPSNDLDVETLRALEDALLKNQYLVTKGISRLLRQSSEWLKSSCPPLKLSGLI